MKPALFSIFAVLVIALPGLATQDPLQHGTIIAMQMADCVGMQRGLMAALSGGGRAPSGELCPQYVLLTDKVVYTIIGKSSSDLLPLAETTKFRFQKNQLLIRIDDAKHESRFEIKEMVLRTEWERKREWQLHADGLPGRHLDATATKEDRP